MSTTHDIEHVALPIAGITCASCVSRIERKLNKLDGVSATVNYATETANVDYDPDVVRPEDLLGAIAAAGYGAVLPATEPERGGGGHEHPDASDVETAALRRRFVICAVLSVPVLLLSMVPALQFDNWQWLSLQLATPVVIWGAWPFHETAWSNAKHARATMDTLISVGVLAAWLWSLYALFLGQAGMPGMRMAFELVPQRGAGDAHIYLEVASVVTTLILLGRFFEARAKRSAGAALKALLELGQKDVSVIGDDGHEERIPVEQLRVGRRFVVRPGEKVATDGIIEEGSSALRTIKQNLGWAFAYNVAALPLAAMGLLNPVIAGAAMALSSVSVVTNALRLRRFRSQRTSSATPAGPLSPRNDNPSATTARSPAARRN